MDDRISPQELYELLPQGRVLVLDMRTRVEFHAAGHISQARFVGLARAMRKPGLLEVGDAELAVLICLSGHRSRWPLERLRAAHPGCRFVDLEGGMLAWWAEGLPSVRR